MKKVIIEVIEKMIKDKDLVYKKIMMENILEVNEVEINKEKAKQKYNIINTLKLVYLVIGMKEIAKME